MSVALSSRHKIAGADPALPEALNWLRGHTARSSEAQLKSGDRNCEVFEQEARIRRYFCGPKVRRASMNLAVHLPHVASWAAFLTVVAWMFVPTN